MAAEGNKYVIRVKLYTGPKTQGHAEEAQSDAAELEGSPCT